MVLGCGCGVELVVCVSVVRVWLCFGAVVWFFGAVFGWAFGCQRACGVCSRLLEMADFRLKRALQRQAEAALPHSIIHSRSGEAPRGGIIPIAKPKFTKKQQLITPSLRFPLKAGGTETLRFPSRSGGNLKEGGNCEL